MRINFADHPRNRKFSFFSSPTVLLWAGLFSLYFFTSSGSLESSDTEARLATAKSWLEGNRGVIAEKYVPVAAAQAPSGEIFAIYSPMQSILMVPWVLVSKVIPASSSTQDNICRFLMALFFFPFVSSLACLLVFLGLRYLGVSSRASYLAILTIALTTTFWHYARNSQEENMIFLGFSIWLYGVSAYSQKNAGVPLFLMAFGACFALATKSSVGPALLVLFVVNIYWLKMRGLPRWFQLILPFAVCITVIAGLAEYNYYRFGSYTEFGYSFMFQQKGLTVFSLNGLLEKLLLLLIGPMRGLLLFSPTIIIAFFSLYHLRHLHHAKGPLAVLSLAGLLAFMASLFLLSSYTVWHSGANWGPRYLISSLVLFAPAFAIYFESFSIHWWAKLLFAISLFIQICSVSLPFSLEPYINLTNPNLKQTTWNYLYSPIISRPAWVIRAASNTLLGHAGTPLEKVSDGPGFEKRVLESSDYKNLFFWPFRLSFRFGYWNFVVAWLIFISGASVSSLLLWMGYRACLSPLVSNANRK